MRSFQRIRGNVQLRGRGPQYPLGRHDDVDVEIVIRGGHIAAREHLPLVHRRDDDGVGVHQARFRGYRELEIAEAAAFAEPSARLVDTDTPGDDEIHWLELVDVDGPRCERRP